MVRFFRLIGLIVAVVVLFMMCYSCGNQSAKNSNESDKEELSTIGTLNGHDWVDLGLPSGTKWATCNVGADNPEDYGNYYAWGETCTKTTYNWSTYHYCNGNYDRLTKYCSYSDYGNNGFADNLTTLQSSDDAATANWGVGWRISTPEEFEELIDMCTWTWMTNGYKLIGPNGNSIFLPAAGCRIDNELHDAGDNGYYWWNRCSAYCAEGVGFNKDTKNDDYDNPRERGYSIRPVCSGNGSRKTSSMQEIKTKGACNGHNWVDLGLPSGTKWATCNVGADKPENYGNYYAWGETRSKSSYTESNYTYSSNPTTLPASADAATVNWGTGWRMPTKEEMDELWSCTYEYTTQNGVDGIKFAGSNGNSIFLPAANGFDSYYWSSSLHTGDSDKAWSFNLFYSDDLLMIKLYRFLGLSVRPVCIAKGGFSDVSTNKQDEKIEKELERQRIEEEKEREAQRKAQEKEMELLLKVAEYREQQKMDLDGASADYYEALASFNNRTASNPFKFEGKVSSCNQKMNHLISIQNKIISIYKQIGDQELINEGIEQKKAYVRSLDEMNYNFERLKMGY